MRVAIRAEIAEVIDLDARVGAAVDRVVAVRALVAAIEAEQVRTAADEVVLAEAAVDDVGAAVALHVVVAVAARAGVVLDRGPGVGDRVARLHVDRHLAGVVDDRAVALDPVVAALAEQHVVARAAGDVGVGCRCRPRGCQSRRRLVEQLDVADVGAWWGRPGQP